jgi:hypothetical protein
MAPREIYTHTVAQHSMVALARSDQVLCSIREGAISAMPVNCI